MIARVLAAEVIVPVFEDARAGDRLAVLYVSRFRWRMRGKSLFSEIVVGIFANQDPRMMILVLVALGLGVKDIQADRIDSDAIERGEKSLKIAL